MSEHQSDSVATLRAAFAAFDRVTVFGRGPSAIDDRGRTLPSYPVLVTGPTYAQRDVFAGEPAGVLIGTPPDLVQAIAERFHSTPPQTRPVLMYTFLSVVAPFDFSRFGVEPVPIGPTLCGAGLGGYDERPYPTSGVFLMLLAAAMGKGADVAGIDLYRHPSGQTYVGSQCDTARFAWPPHHSLQCDLHHIRQALASSVGRFNLSPDLQNAIDQTSSSNERHE